MILATLAEKPVWIECNELGANRFDPLYYDPTLTVAEHHLRRNGALKWKRLRDLALNIYSFGAYELTNRIRFTEPGSTTVPFITVSEMGTLTVAISAARHIDAASHVLLAKSKCGPGTVLLSMAGTVGKVAVIPSDAPECNSNQDLAKIVINPDLADAHCLAAYLTTSVGQAACFREAAGAIQKHLYLYNIESLPIPNIPRPLRLAIGNKIRAAEYLWTSAQRLSIESSASLYSILHGSENQSTPSGIPQSDSHTSTMDTSYAWTVTLASAFRFDPPYYHPKLVKNHNWLRSYGGVELNELVDSREGIAGGSTPLGTNYPIQGIRFIRTQDYGPDGIEVDKCVFIDEDHDRKNARSRLQVGDVLLSITGEFVSAVVDEECLPANISQHTVRIRLKDTENTNPYWLSLFLNSQFGIMETQRYSYGLTRPAIDYQAVRSIFVPCPPPRIQHEIGEKAWTAQKHRRRMDRLVKNAIIRY